jgi:hypothetical protein
MVAQSERGYPFSRSDRAPSVSASEQAFVLLRAGFTLLPIVAGLDKFFYLLGQWDAYLSSAFASISPLGVGGTMLVVGVVEIAAGVLVAIAPRIGGYVVAGWLLAIIVNLFLRGGYLDVALRDLGLMIGAVALARLAVAHGRTRAA